MTRWISLPFVLILASFASGEEPDVRYRSDVDLAATILLPSTDGPWPAAVIVHGSGSSDRTNCWARQVAELFVVRGVAVLLTDKRGSGRSGGSWQTAGFDALASDAIAGVDYLRSRPDIDPRRIGLIGLSQGGWIVPVAAARHPDIAFIVNLSGATVGYAEQSYLEMANTARQAGLDSAAASEVLALNRAAGRYAMGGAWEPYAAARARALAGPAKGVAAGFPESREAPIWNFLRRVGAFDPLPYWSVVEQPLFIAYGEEDERDNVPVRESVRRMTQFYQTLAKTNYEIVVAPGAGHSLKTSDGAFAPPVVDALSSWLRKYVVR